MQINICRHDILQISYLQTLLSYLHYLHYLQICRSTSPVYIYSSCWCDSTPKYSQIYAMYIIYSLTACNISLSHILSSCFSYLYTEAYPWGFSYISSVRPSWGNAASLIRFLTHFFSRILTSRKNHNQAPLFVVSNNGSEDVTCKSTKS